MFSDFPRDRDGHLLFDPTQVIELETQMPHVDQGRGGWFGTGSGPLNHTAGNIVIEAGAFIWEHTVSALRHTLGDLPWYS